MTNPVLLVADGDAAVRAALERDLTRRFGADYRVVAADAAPAALARLRQLRDEGAEVALLLVDQWLPGMTGVELLRQAQAYYPGAQKGVLVTYGDWTTVEPLQRAAILGQIDFFLFKPWAHPDEWLYPTIGDYLSRWARAYRPRFEAIRVIGEQRAPRSHELRDRLERNAIPYGFYAADSAAGRRLLESLPVDGSRLPVVALHTGQVLADPSNEEFARAFGVTVEPDPRGYDVAIVGAGPAGLSAAVYAASEGLHTVVLEYRSLGGQAGTSALIRNYLGFPLGLPGEELTTRSYQQALLLGANFVFARRAAGLGARGTDFAVALEGGGEVVARAVVIATGVEYRPIGVPGLEARRGAGVFYGAAVTEARAMRGQRVAVVGGGNSAGQAAVHLAKYADRVTLLVRGDSLAASMSDYLLREIDEAPGIDVRLQTEVVDAVGQGWLEALVLRHRTTGQTETLPADAVFLMVGGAPRTEWLGQAVRRARDGSVLTGTGLLRDGEPPAGWPLARPPLMLETSLPGVFAVGDVRAGAIKRVASAVGDGSVVISLVHHYLAERGQAAGPPGATQPPRNAAAPQQPEGKRPRGAAAA
jgi:thioredoxin reductase (NADPH)